MLDRPDVDHGVTFEMVCGKGGYAASIARIWAGSGLQRPCPWNCRRSGQAPSIVENAITLAQGRGDGQNTRTATHYLGPAEWVQEPASRHALATEGAQKSCGNGNPGMVFAKDVEYGDERGLP